MALDETYRSASIHVTRWISIITLLTNIIFYLVLVCRWRLTEKLHWYICNFVISEVIRNVASILRGVLEAEMLPLLHVQPQKGQTLGDITKDQMIYINTRTVLDTIFEVTHFVSMLFALIAFLYFYRQLKRPFITERFGKLCLIVSAVIWAAGILYFASVAALRIRQDSYEIIFYADNYATIVFASVFGFIDVILFGFTIALLCTRPLSNNGNDYLMNLKQKKSKICILSILIFLLLISSAMLMFLAIVEINVPFDDGPLGEARTVVEDLVGLWMNLLAIGWPFIWLVLDTRLNHEFEKFYIWAKKSMSDLRQISISWLKGDLRRGKFNVNHVQTFRFQKGCN